MARKEKAKFKNEVGVKEENNFMPLDCSWLANEDRFDEYEYQASHLPELLAEARIATGHLAALMDMVVDHGIPKDKFRDWVKGTWKPPST